MHIFCKVGNITLLLKLCKVVSELRLSIQILRVAAEDASRRATAYIILEVSEVFRVLYKR
jgi:hypothetical protein